MTDWIGNTFTSHLGWDHLETLVDTDNRMAGSNGELRAAKATRSAFAVAGARNVQLDSFEIQGWTRGTAQIQTSDTAYDCIALPRSPNATASGHFIDLGYGLPGDFDQDLENAVVMAASNVPDWYDRFIHRREKYYHAVEAGAAAFVFRNHLPGCLAPTGSVGTSGQPIGEIPAVGVSKETGWRLARLSESKPVTVDVEAEINQATSQNVHADLGPETRQEILLTSHVDAHDIAEGASDNGAGTALIVEIAKALTTHPSPPDTRVHLISYGAEEVGLCGSTHDQQTRDLSNIKAIINIDGAGRGRTLKIYTHGFEDVTSPITTVSDRFDHPIQTPPTLNPHSDHWPYVAKGIPGLQVTSETDAEGRGWGHTHGDTLDKLEVRTFREQAILLAELVTELAHQDIQIDHREEGAIANQLEEEDLAKAMKITGDWPY